LPSPSKGRRKVCRFPASTIPSSISEKSRILPPSSTAGSPDGD